RATGFARRAGDPKGSAACPAVVANGVPPRPVAGKAGKEPRAGPVRTAVRLCWCPVATRVVRIRTARAGWSGTHVKLRSSMKTVRHLAIVLGVGIAASGVYLSAQQPPPPEREIGKLYG